MNIEEAAKEIQKTIAQKVLMSVWREANCGVYDTTDIREILKTVADEYGVDVEL